MKIGFVGGACTSVGCRPDRMFKLASYSKGPLVEIVNDNLDYTLKTLKFCYNNKIFFCRKSDLFFLSILEIDYTYSDVNDTANRLAKELISMGIEKGDKTSIFSSNIPQWYAIFLTIFEVGVIVVPISPILGAEDLRQKLQNSKVQMIISLDILHPTLVEVCSDFVILTKIIISLGDILSPIKRILAQLFRKTPAIYLLPSGVQNMVIYCIMTPLVKLIDCDPVFK